MEVYILDSLNRRTAVIDQFVSLIWTERWAVYGDFEIDLYSSYANRSALKPDTWLAMSESKYVGRIESVEDDVDDDGNKTLKITGRMIEGIFDDRALLGTWTAAPADVARAMFHDICVTGTFDVGDIIPGIIEGSFMPASTIPEPADAITITPTTITTLGDGIANQVCAVWDLGFRILRDDSTGLLYFEVYSGSDRTTDQNTLNAVVFAPQLDNLQNTSETTKIDTAKNVAYVYSSAGTTTIVYSTDIDPTINGFERRVLIVDATDIESPTTDQLTQRGYQALAAAQTAYLFDGEISQNCQYVYGIDYNLGDLVEMQNVDGVVSQMRVTEQIFSEDATGKKSYPTLAAYDTLNVGTWLAWNNNKAWQDLDSDETTWSEEP